MNRAPPGAGFVIFFLWIVFSTIALLVAAIAAVIRAIAAAVLVVLHAIAANDILVFAILACGAVAYGAAYLIDCNKRRRQVLVTGGTVVGAAVFLFFAHLIGPLFPVRAGAGAIAAPLGFFLIFGALPVVAAVLGIAWSLPELRASMRGELLVDVDALDPMLRDPIEPFLPDFIPAPWGRFPLLSFFDRARRRKPRITAQELEQLYRRATRLVEAAREQHEAATATANAEADRRCAEARREFVTSLSDTQRALLARAFVRTLKPRAKLASKGKKGTC